MMETISPSGKTACPVCDGSHLAACVQIHDVPVYCNVLHDTRDEALAAATGDIDLAFCRGCGHLFNARFDPDRIDYTGKYENSLHYSGRFQAYAEALAEQLVERNDLRGKTIIEIACGQGDFLQLLCSLGGNRGIGFDPGHVPGRSEASAAADLTFVQDYYSEAYAHYRADLICCRHALEHIERPGAFLRMVRRAIGERSTKVFFEVPDVRFTLDDLGIWDIIYEHCGYFSDASLRKAFRRNGFRVDSIARAFGGQFLTLHGTPADEVPGASDDDLSELADKINRFARVYADKVETWRARLLDLERAGQRVVLWGAGSKGVSFLNTLKVCGAVECLVDLNPHKHGRYIAGTGHQVRAPQALAQVRPDVVIVLNPQYRDEIASDLRGLGVHAEILVDEIQ